MAELSSILLFVVGPTATGKSRFAINIAQEFSGEIINADSVQIYKGFHIGASSPRGHDLQSVPHHLYNFVEIGSNYTAGDYFNDSRLVLNKISKNLKLIVGGSGFYIQAFENGMFDSVQVNENTESQIEGWHREGGNELLMSKLKSVDEESAMRIHQADTYRLKRALGVTLETGQPWSWLKNEFQQKSTNVLSNYNKIKVAFYFERDDLRRIIKARTETMLKDGLIAETEYLLKNAPHDWRPLSSVGYKEAVQYIRGPLTKESLVEEITKSTMALAKRQKTWFQRDKSIHWFHGEKEKRKAQEFIIDQINTTANNKT